MFLGRTFVRAYALVSALGGSGAFYGVGLVPLAVIAQTPPEKKETGPVPITIMVIEGEKKGKEFDSKLSGMEKLFPGYNGARVVDELKTSVEQGSSVSLEIMRKSGKPQLLRVMVKKIAADGTVKLQVSVDALKLSTETTHPKGAKWYIVAHPLKDDKALFLAVKTEN